MLGILGMDMRKAGRWTVRLWKYWYCKGVVRVEGLGGGEIVVFGMRAVCGIL